MTVIAVVRGAVLHDLVSSYSTPYGIGAMYKYLHAAWHVAK